MVNKTTFETINIDDFNHDPINQAKVQSYPPELVGRFNSFIVTAFDDSMTVEMQLRTLIKWIKENIDVTMNALDNMEAFKQDSMAFQNHVKNTLVNLINEFTDKFDDNLKFETLEILNKWFEDGTLSDLVRDVINEEVVNARGGKENLGQRLDETDEHLLNINNELLNARGDKDNLGQRLNETDEQLEQNDKKMSSVLVTTQQPRNHNAFTDTTWNNIHEKYVSVYRGGKVHNDLTGAIFMTTSDNGEIWSIPKNIIDDPLDCRDPSIYTLEDGTMLLNYFKYNDTKGSVFITHININGDVLDQKMLSSLEYEFCTSPIVKFDGKLYLSTYGIGNLYLYENAGESSIEFSLIKIINTETQKAMSEPELFVSNGTLNCLIRSDENDNSPIYYINNILINDTPLPTGLIGKPSGVFDMGDGTLLVGVRYLSPYVYYGEVKIYRISYPSYTMVDTYLIDNSYDNDNAYIGFASRDNDELIISYYTKLLNSASVVKLLKTTVNQFKTKKRLIDAKHPLASHEKPYVLADNKSGHPILTLIQEHEFGQFIRLVNEKGDIIGIITKDNQGKLSIYNPNGTMHLASNGNTLYLGDGFGEINTLGSFVWRKAMDIRGVATHYNLRAYRIPDDNTSGALNVAVRESGESESRPKGSIPTGYEYFDTTLMKPIWYNGSVWKDATGTTV